MTLGRIISNEMRNKCIVVLNNMAVDTSDRTLSDTITEIEREIRQYDLKK